jgi:hypothetical protein
MNPTGILIVVICGLFVTAAILDWQWLMDHRKARRLTSVIGRNGARITYVVLGVMGMIVGALIATGVVQMTAAQSLK